MLLTTIIAANLITGLVGAGYMGASIGSKLGRVVNRKIYGKYSRHNEVVTICRASDIIQDEWYCREHKQWNWSGDECNCCAREDERYYEKTSRISPRSN